MKPYKTIDVYIANFPQEVQVILEKLRQVIHTSVPNIHESISYGIPTFKLDGVNLVHFAAYKNHIGFYPTSSGISAFSQDLLAYKSAKGSVQFPINKPIPFDIVKKIVQFRKQEIESNSSHS